MSGQSKQESAAEGLYNEVGQANVKTANPWKGYRQEFDFGAMDNQLDDIFGQYENIINRNASSDIAQGQQGMASRLASRGITGGSVLDDSISKVATNVGKQKYNALANLGASRGEKGLSLMDTANRNKMFTTGQGVNVDQQNIMNLLRKFGMKGDALQGLDDDTWLDDIFSGLNAAGGLATGAGSLGFKPFG